MGPRIIPVGRTVNARPTANCPLPTSLQIPHRVHRRAVDPHLDVHAGAEAVAAAAARPDALALPGAPGAAGAGGRGVPVAGGRPPAVLDARVVPAGARPPGGRRAPAAGRPHRSAA